ncbi:hypothetical protein CEXT_625651 [Caerostris extrusa]|uniref:Uncharacterized protein n=1 Tax=Caerostris extrusa TaxID=172846 RepID=A0AAV4XL90_CAEEX|nr:hypothetical protein CEXT_625651 [Caerostris extrusa]
MGVELSRRELEMLQPDCGDVDWSSERRTGTDRAFLGRREGGVDGEGEKGKGGMGESDDSEGESEEIVCRMEIQMSFDEDFFLPPLNRLACVIVERR